MTPRDWHGALHYLLVIICVVPLDPQSAVVVTAEPGKCSDASVCAETFNVLCLATERRLREELRGVITANERCHILRSIAREIPGPETLDDQQKFVTFVLQWQNRKLQTARGQVGLLSLDGLVVEATERQRLCLFCAKVREALKSKSAESLAHLDA